MITVNKLNGADKIIQEYAKELLSIKKDNIPLIGAELGSAYGGNVEAVGKIWRDKGLVYGFDTFKGHPRHLAPKNSFEATCMDNWYKEEVYGTDKLSYEYQRKELDRQGLNNVILVKGEVTKDSCKDIPYLNYAFLDMDIMESMDTGYEAVKDKLLKGHVLFLHDVLPPHHIPRLFHWCDDIVLGRDSEMWNVVGNWASQYLMAVVKIK